MTGQSESVRLVLPHTAKPIDVVSETDIRVSRVLVVAIPRAEVVSAEPPGAAANHLGFALVRASWVLAWASRVIVHGVKVVAPFPDIATHVKQPPGIGAFLADRPRPATRIFIEPGVLAQL